MATFNIPSCVLNQVQRFQQDFQQFGQDLQSGRISAARSDLVTLQNEVPQFNCTQTVQCDSQFAQAANQLALSANRGSDTTGRDEDSTPQQGYSGQVSAGQRIDRALGGGQSNPVSLGPGELAQPLQAVNPSHAQLGYASVQQVFQDAGGVTSTSESTHGSLSILA
jgi:hypothetical protein